MGGDEENKLYCRLRLAWWIVPLGASPLTMTNYINFIFSWKKWKKNISYFQIFLQKMKNYFGFAFYLKLICAVIPTQKKNKESQNKQRNRQTNKQTNKQLTLKSVAKTCRTPLLRCAQRWNNRKKSLQKVQCEYSVLEVFGIWYLNIVLWKSVLTVV